MKRRSWLIGLVITAALSVALLASNGAGAILSHHPATATARLLDATVSGSGNSGSGNSGNSGSGNCTVDIGDNTNCTFQINTGGGNNTQNVSTSPNTGASTGGGDGFGQLATILDDCLSSGCGLP